MRVCNFVMACTPDMRLILRWHKIKVRSFLTNEKVSRDINSGMIVGEEQVENNESTCQSAAKSEDTHSITSATRKRKSLQPLTSISVQKQIIRPVQNFTPSALRPIRRHSFRRFSNLRPADSPVQRLVQAESVEKAQDGNATMDNIGDADVGGPSFEDDSDDNMPQNGKSSLCSDLSHYICPCCNDLSYFRSKEHACNRMPI